MAQLLEEPLGLVLEKLQEATDAGVPLADRGAGQLTWPAAIVTALQQSTLPSLLRFWHARLGEILSGGKAPDRASRPSGAPRTVARGQSAAEETEKAFDLAERHPEVDRARLFEPPRHSVLPTQTAPPRLCQAITHALRPTGKLLAVQRLQWHTTSWQCARRLPAAMHAALMA